MNNNITNLKRIPFVPKMSREFKPMKHYLCETDTSAKLISRKAFMRQLAQQPCPKGQVFIDFDDGIVYLFPFDPERAAQFTVAYGEFETEYKRFYREQEAIRAGRRMTVVHLDQFDDSEAEGDEMQSTWLVSEETPESIYLNLYPGNQEPIHGTARHFGFQAQSGCLCACFYGQ